MPGYLDQYGAGDERREKILKRGLLALIIVIVGGGLLYLFFHNYRQEKRAKEFFSRLAAKDYQAAYAFWGCTAEKPCREYPLNKFLEDWGPQSHRANAGALSIESTESCGSGVILDISNGGRPDEKLWVERGALTISFSPWPECPYGRPIGKFWKNLKRRFQGAR